MDVVLILPPNPFLEEQKRNCPLGILYVAAAWREAGNNISIVDLRESDEWDIPESDLYGISSTSIDLSYAIKVVDFIRLKYPKSKIMLGGIAAIDPRVNNQFNYVVHGEGESFDIFNFAYKKYYNSLDDIPFPARNLLPDSTVVNKFLCHNNIKATTIIGSRGCPFNCLFCSSPFWWQGRFRLRSPENIVAEINTLIDIYNIEELRFQDDEMNLNKNWLLRLSALMPRKIKFRCNARAEIGNFEELAKVGCYEVSIGVETANPIAHKVNKHVNLESTERGIREAYNAGLDLRLCFIIGLPFDSNVANNTIAFLERMPPAKIFLHVLMPLPGSQIADNINQYGVLNGEIETSVPVNNKIKINFIPYGFTEDLLLEEYWKLRYYLEDKQCLIH